MATAHALISARQNPHFSASPNLSRAPPPLPCQRIPMYGENDSREGLVQPSAQPHPSSIPQASHGQAGDGTNAPAASSAQAEKLPFYKRRWFIISSLIGIFLGIPLLFVILFPVLKVIAQSIVNKAALNIQTAAIQVPQNATYVSLLL